MARIVRFSVGILASVWLVTSAQADELWVCNFHHATAVSSDPTRFVLHNKTLWEYGLGTTLDVLVDNDVAIVAVAGVAIAPDRAGLNYAMIGTKTVAIDRKTGDIVSGGVGLYGPGTQAPPDYGNCTHSVPPTPKSLPTEKGSGTTPNE